MLPLLLGFIRLGGFEQPGNIVFVRKFFLERSKPGDAFVETLRCQEVARLAERFQHSLFSLIVEDGPLQLQDFFVARELLQHGIQERTAIVVASCGKETSSFRNRLRPSLFSLIVEDVLLELQYFLVVGELLQDGIQQSAAIVVAPSGKEASSFRDGFRPLLFSLIVEYLFLQSKDFIV